MRYTCRICSGDISIPVLEPDRHINKIVNIVHGKKPMKCNSNVLTHNKPLQQGYVERQFKYKQVYTFKFSYYYLVTYLMSLDSRGTDQ